MIIGNTWRGDNILEKQIEEAALLLLESQRPSVLTGAGISRESGIPTYRDDTDSYWANPAVRRLATVAGFHESPVEVWNFFQTMRALMEAAQPNAGHQALAELEEYVPGLPIITQNIDHLQERAGSTTVIHLHGLITQTRCSRYCQGVPSIVDEAHVSAQPSVKPPLCPFCGAFLRPHVTLFGEYLHSEPLNTAETVAHQTDLMLIVGTSGVVAPASEIPAQAKQSGAKLIEINPWPSAITPLADYWLPVSASEALPAMVSVCKKAFD